MERGWRHEQFSQGPARLQWEGKKGEKGYPKQGAAGRFNRTTPRALLSQPLSAYARSGGAVGDGQMVRNQEGECTERCNCAPPRGDTNQVLLLQTEITDYLSPDDSTGNTVQKDFLWGLEYFAN